MKKTLTYLLISALLLCIFSGCAEAPESTYTDGYNQGKYDMFNSIYLATSKNKALLSSGVPWETEHFTLIFKSKVVDDVTELTFDMTLSNTTLEECFNNKEMFFNIYSATNHQILDVILDNDNYFDYMALQHLENNNGTGTVKITNKTAKLLITIIVIESQIYSSIYFI